MAKALDALVEKEVTRKEFLTLAGLGLASVMGFSKIIGLLTGKTLSNQVHASNQPGYSTGDYGG